MTKKDIIKQLINKCDLIYDNGIISKEPVLIDFWDYLATNSENYNKNISHILHPGSELYDALILFYISFLAILNNEFDMDDFIHNLESGSLVLFEDKYGKTERYRVVGIEKGYNQVLKKQDTFITIEQFDFKNKSGEQRKLNSTSWPRIKPYFGNSTSLDGKGIKTKNSNVKAFFKEVLGINEPNTFNASSIIVARRQYFDDYFDKCSISFFDKEVKLHEIVTASYLTEENSFRHSGNAANTEPILKFTSNIDVARREAISKENNTTTGLFVLGEDIISRNITGLPILMNSRAVNLFATSSRMDLFDINELASSSKTECKYYACTKEKLNKLNTYPKEKGNYINDIYRRISNIKKHKIIEHIVSKPINLNEYYDLKRIIKRIKNSDYDSPEKDDFFVNSFSLLKLFTTVPFSIEDLEKETVKLKINLEQIDEKILKLIDDKEKLPDYFEKDCQNVIDSISALYDIFKQKNEKFNKLKEILISHTDEYIAIIVGKQYFADILKDLLKNENLFSDKIDITTYNKFNYSKFYNLLIATSDFSNTRFNQIECINAPTIINILYDHEKTFYLNHKRKIQQKENIYNGQNNNETDDLSFIKESEWLDEYVSIDNELDKLMIDINRYSDYRKYIGKEGASSKIADTIAVATFENGEQAFFTKMYKAYVFDSDNAVVKEKNVEELVEGDELLFIRTDNKTRDIVDEILFELITENVLEGDIKEYYMESKVWKNKLKSYKKTNRLSTKELANELCKTGIGVGEQTIKYWLDDDAHIVGPKDPESIRYIGIFVDDKELIENYQKYHNACKNTRKVRMKILEQVGEVIVMRMSNEKPEENSLHERIYEKVDKLGVLARIDSFSMVSNQVPINMINRLLSV